MEERRQGELRVIGTGFWITRYGLFATAAHVVTNLQGSALYVLHIPAEFKNTLHLRPVLRITFFQEVDLAICQAENYVREYPSNPLSNLRCRLSTRTPDTRENLLTYAYPENAPLIFGNPECPPTIHGAQFEGNLIEVMDADAVPFLPYIHYSTNIRIRSGASGGPVFDTMGFVLGINCRGWDFDGAEHEGDELSSVIPVAYLLHMVIEPLQLPRSSFEYSKIPTPEIRTAYSVRQLVDYGHLQFDIGK